MPHGGARHEKPARKEWAIGRREPDRLLMAAGLLIALCLRTARSPGLLAITDEVIE
jgi:hypothetical protein